ncbi:MAG: hypothetical protein RR490_09125, partial [Niameybacter sp.]
MQAYDTFTQMKQKGKGDLGWDWSKTNPADANRFQGIGSGWANSALGIVQGGGKPTSNGAGGYGGSGGGSSWGGSGGGDWYAPEFTPPKVDRSVYENLANNVLNSQLSSLGALK